MSKIYLAWSERSHITLERHAAEAPVDLLVAFPFLKAFNERRRAYNIRSWCLDSGAFSAWNAGLKVDVNEYCAVAADQDAGEVFALDVIGDPDGTYRNAMLMAERFPRVIPTVHPGVSSARVLEYARDFHKLAIGGVALSSFAKRTQRFISGVFALTWPKPIHGFGLAAVRAMHLAPFHSVDASSWTTAPKRFGHYCGFTGSQIALGAPRNDELWVEVVEHQRRQAYFAARWSRELAILRESCK